MRGSSAVTRWTKPWLHCMECQVWDDSQLYMPTQSGSIAPQAQSADAVRRIQGHLCHYQRSASFSLVVTRPGFCRSVSQSCCALAGPAVRACRGLRPARLQEAGGGAVLRAQCQPALRAGGKAAGPMGWGESFRLLPHVCVGVAQQSSMLDLS